MKLVVDLNDEVYNNMVVKNEYTDRDVIAVHNALMGAIHIPDGKVLEIIKEKEKGFSQPWSRDKEIFNFGWISCAQEIGKAIDKLWGDKE